MVRQESIKYQGNRKGKMNIQWQSFWLEKGNKVEVFEREGHFIGKTKEIGFRKILRNGGGEIATGSEKVKEILETFYSPKYQKHFIVQKYLVKKDRTPRGMFLSMG